MSGPSPRILIVEDEALISLLLERQLRKLGCTEIRKTPSGEGAVELTLTQSFDLILMDIHLAKEMDGIEAAGIIMSRSAPPQVAFMTAFGDPSTRKAALDLEPLAFMEKPLVVENLRALLLSPALARP